jgi:hypothetical protein
MGIVRKACVYFELLRSLGEELNHEKLYFRLFELYFFYWIKPGCWEENLFSFDIQTAARSLKEPGLEKGFGKARFLGEIFLIVE